MTEPSSSVNTQNSDISLPTRLFATDRFPVGCLNIYSKPDILSFVRRVLAGSPEWDIIKSSDFGKLFEIPVSRCPHSCKLLHALIVRQLITKKKYEMWTVFGGQPLRFSLVEFGSITGLNCGEYADDYDPDDNSVTVLNDQFWEELIGGDAKTTLADIGNMLENDTTMPGWRKLALALLMIVDGVLIAKSQVHMPTPKYVMMLKDVKDFMSFPWGRESFFKLINTIRPGKKIPGKIEDPIAHFTGQCQQRTMRVQGFILSLQLLAFKCISGMLQKVPNYRDERNLIEIAYVGESKQTEIGIKDVRNVEADPNLVVTPWLDIEPGHPDGWAEWGDENLRDKKVLCLQNRVKQRHVFNKSDWPGGDDSLPKYVHVQSIPVGGHQKHIVTRVKKRDDRKGMQVPLQPCKNITKSDKPLMPKRQSNDQQYPEDLERLKAAFQSHLDVFAEQNLHLSHRILVLENELNIKNPQVTKSHSSDQHSAEDMDGLKDFFQHQFDVLSEKNNTLLQRVLVLEKRMKIVGSSHFRRKTSQLSRLRRRLPKPSRFKKSIFDVDESDPPLPAPTDHSQTSEVDASDHVPAEGNAKAAAEVESIPNKWQDYGEAYNAISDIPPHWHEGNPLKDSYSDENNLTSQLRNIDVEEFMYTLIGNKEDSLDEQRNYDNVISEQPSNASHEEDMASAERLSKQIQDNNEAHKRPFDLVVSTAQALIALKESPTKASHQLKRFNMNTKPDDAETPSADVESQNSIGSTNEASHRLKRLKLSPSDVSSKSGIVSLLPAPQKDSSVFGSQEILPEDEIILSQHKLPSHDRVQTDVSTAEQLDLPDHPLVLSQHKLPIHQDLQLVIYQSQPQQTEAHVSAQKMEKDINLPQHIFEGPASNTMQLPLDGALIPSQLGKDAYEEAFIGTQTNSSQRMKQDAFVTNYLNSEKQSSVDAVAPENTTDDADDDIDDHPSTPTHSLCLSDSSPVRNREKHVLSAPEKDLVRKMRSKTTNTALDDISALDSAEFKNFKKTLSKDPKAQYLTHCGFLFDNKFLLDLAKPEHWIDSLHIEVLVSVLSRRHHDIMLREKAMFTNPWLVQHLQGKYRNFKAGSDITKFRLAETVRRFINDNGREWFKDIDVVYAPMNWGGKHWVGLAINLPMWFVEVLDPQPSWKEQKEVDELMAPVLELLPYVIQFFCKPPKSQDRGLQPFVYDRVKGIYENTRSGDCGPVAMKFMELHVNGLSATHLHQMTDKHVDTFRKQYAMDIFQDLVVPLYDEEDDFTT